MGSPVQRKILDALLMTLRPLARALLRSGIGYTEFADMAKLAFVNVAAEEFGVRGRATNTSRIAAMTGISRKEVKRIKDLGPGALVDDFVTESPASVVLQYWHSDPDFVAADGQPAVLEYDSGDNSFAKLVAKYAGDIPPGAMRAELKRVGAVEEADAKRLVALHRHYMPKGVDERLIIGLQDILAAGADTLAFNCDPKRVAGVDTRYQTVASVDGVLEEHLPKIRADIRQQLTSVGNDVSDYLEDYETRDKASIEIGSQVGIGLFYYELGSSSK